MVSPHLTLPFLLRLPGLNFSSFYVFIMYQRDLCCCSFPSNAYIFFSSRNSTSEMDDFFCHHSFFTKSINLITPPELLHSPCLLKFLKNKKADILRVNTFHLTFSNFSATATAHFSISFHFEHKKPTLFQSSHQNSRVPFSTLTHTLSHSSQ